MSLSNVYIEAPSGSFRTTNVGLFYSYVVFIIIIIIFNMFEIRYTTTESMFMLNICMIEFACQQTIQNNTTKAQLNMDFYFSNNLHFSVAEQLESSLALF